MSMVLRGLECCMTMDANKCKECPFRHSDNPKCMIELMKMAKYTIISDSLRIKEQDEELRQARWGTNYGK